jgi:hypothetical protein
MPELLDAFLAEIKANFCWIFLLSQANGSEIYVRFEVIYMNFGVERRSEVNRISCGNAFGACNLGISIIFRDFLDHFSRRNVWKENETSAEKRERKAEITINYYCDSCERHATAFFQHLLNSAFWNVHNFYKCKVRVEQAPERIDRRAPTTINKPRTYSSAYTGIRRRIMSFVLLGAYGN